MCAVECGRIIGDNDHGCGICRECHIDLAAGHICDLQQLDLGGFRRDCINGRLLVGFLCAVQRDDGMLCIGHILVRDHDCHLGSILVDSGICTGLGDILGLCGHQRFTECAALAVIIRIEVDAGEDIAAAAPERCEIHARIRIAAERLRLRDRAGGIVLAAEIVFGDAELGLRIILVDRSLNGRQDRHIDLTPLTDPAVLDEALFIERSDGLEPVLRTLAAGFGIIMDIEDIEQPDAGLFGCLLHRIEIVIEIPVIAALCLNRFPFVVVIGICEMIVCGVAVECRAEDLSLRIELLDGCRNLSGFVAQLLHADLLRMDAAVCTRPERRLIVERIALHTGRGLRIAELADDVIHIFIHIDLAVGEIGLLGECAALDHLNFVPARRRSGFLLGDGALFVGGNIARELESRQLIPEAVFLCFL